MAIGLASENKLPAAYTAHDNEDGTYSLQVGRRKLPVLRDSSFASVANALNIFAPDGTPATQAGWQLTLRDTFAEKETTVVAAELQEVMRALVFFAVEEGVYVPDVEKPERRVKKAGRKSTSARSRRGAAVAGPSPDNVTQLSASRRRAAEKSSPDIVQGDISPAAEDTAAATPAPVAPIEEAKVAKARKIRNAAPKEQPAVTQGKTDEAAEAIPPANKPRKRKEAAISPPVEAPSAKSGRKSKTPDAGAPTGDHEATVAQPTQSPPAISSATTKVRGSRSKKADAVKQPAEVQDQTPSASVEPARQSRSTRKAALKLVDAEPKTPAADNSGEAYGAFGGNETMDGGMRASLVPDVAVMRASVTTAGAPANLKHYMMGYEVIDQAGTVRLDFTALTTDGRSKRKIVGPDTGNTPTLFGYEIKSAGAHCGWLIIEKPDALVMVDLPGDMPLSTHKNIGGVMQRIAVNLIPKVNALRTAA